MHLHKFEVVDCCGSNCEYLEIEIDEDFNIYNDDYKILCDNGYIPDQCESCYDSAYRLIDCGPVETSPN